MKHLEKAMHSKISLVAFTFQQSHIHKEGTVKPNGSGPFMKNTLPTFCSLTKLFCLIDFTDCTGDKGSVSDMQVRPLRVSILWPTADLYFSLENLSNSAAMSSKAPFIKRMAAIYLA